MAYMSTEHAARIRADLKAAFPAKDGWKISCAITSGKLGISVRLMAGPIEPRAFDYDPWGRDPEACRSANEARARGLTRRIESESINHYHFRDHYPADVVKVLEKVIGITLKEHWDESDVQSDYFNCAFYPDFAFGRWDKPFQTVKATEPA